MPTESQSPCFREAAVSSAQQLIDFASPELESLVDRAEETFKRCRKVAQKAWSRDYPSLVLFRHMIDMADGIEVLLRAGTSGPMIPILRTMFEAYLSLYYIIESTSDAGYEKRSLAWLCFGIHDQIIRKGKRDGKLEEDRRTGESCHDPDLITIAKEFLQQPDCADIAAKLNGKTQIKLWTALCDKTLNDRRALAKYLKGEDLYDDIYGRWSAVTHATHYYRHLVEPNDETVDFGPLRCSAQLRDSVGCSYGFLLDARNLMTKRFLPGEDLSQSKERDNFVTRLERFNLKRSTHQT